MIMVFRVQNGYRGNCMRLVVLMQRLHSRHPPSVRHAPLPLLLTRLSFTNFGCIWVLHSTHENTHVKAINAVKNDKNRNAT